MMDGIRKMRRRGKRAIWCAVIDGEAYSAADLEAATGYDRKYCMNRMQAVREEKIPLRRLLQPKPDPMDGLARRHQIEQVQPDGSVRRGLGIFIEGKAWLLRDIMRYTGLSPNSVRARLERVFAGELMPREVLGPPVDWRYTNATRRRAHAHCESFTEVERLAFCRSWAAE